jgi:hypothetical protein
LLLFIDRLPLHSWIDHSTTVPRRKWLVPLPVLLAECEWNSPSIDVPLQRWALDTAFNGDAFAWRSHIQDGGLDPDSQIVGSARARTPLGSARLPIRSAALWLVSNIPALREKPFRLALDPGITFNNVDQRPDPDSDSPLIGVRALLRAGVKVQIDFAAETLSLWTPGPWYQRVYLFLRRTLSGYATIPLNWSRRPN